MENFPDFMVIDDTAAGVLKQISRRPAVGFEIIVTTPDQAAAIVDAYATIKVVLRHSPANRFRLSSIM